MKKIFTILSIVLLGAISCTKSNFDEPKPEESGLVEVSMSMTLPNWLMAETKAGGEMAHKPDIDNIRVAMFGTSGYLQAYTKAELTGATPTENDTRYTFTVLLPVYEGEAHVHVIANGDSSIPFDNETEHTVMSKMTTTGGVGAYWARIVLPDGILAQWTENGTMQTNDNHNFVPTAATLAKFQDIILIRNFAEVKLVEVPSNLTNVSYALVNVPKTGSVAPIQRTYMDDTDDDGEDDDLVAEYIDTYAQYSYDTAKEKMTKSGADDYNGYMVDTDIIKTLPGDDDFVEYDGATGLNGAFAYERTVATANTTCLLIKGTYTVDNKEYYYRLDLLGKSQPLALYRNYQYQVRIGRLGGKGYPSAEEAMKHNSSDNVSAQVEAKTLTDISDGSSRLEVEYIEKNFVVTESMSGATTFWVSYKPVANGTVNNTNVTIEGPEKVEILNPDGTGTGNYYAPAITSAITKGTESGGKLYFNFTLDKQGAADKVSTFTVKAHNDSEDPDYYSELTRVVTVRVIKQMTMTLSLSRNPIEGGKDQTTVLNIALSDTLQPSMFPLQFYIEDTNHTLNPTGYDGPTHTAAHAITVPVKADKSIVDGANSFYFIRTVNWDEYEPLRDAYVAGDTGAIVFHTEFKTLVDDSATKIYVDNEYFTMGNISLTNTQGSVHKTDKFTFVPSMFGTNDREESSTDGRVKLTFSSVVNAGATATYIQMANTNTQPTATFTTVDQNTKITRVSIDFVDDTHARGNISVSNATGSISGRNEYYPYTRYWPTTGTHSTNNLTLTFTRYNNNSNHHRITLITVEYEYYQ